MQTIGQIVTAAQSKADIAPAKFAKHIKVSPSLLSSIMRDRPVVLSDETLHKLGKGGVELPPDLVETHNYVARECAKIKKWDAKSRAKVLEQRSQLPLPMAQVEAPNFVPLKLSPELQAASDAVTKELLENGTVGGIPMDTSKMVLAPAAPKKKKAAPRKVKPSEPKTIQSTLPNFLGQLNNARIEEMVAEMVYKRLQEKLDVALAQLFTGTAKRG